MKTIEVDDEFCRYIANHTLHIGESAFGILRRVLRFSAASQPAALVSKTAPALTPAPAMEMKPTNPAKDKVHATRELLLFDEYAEQKRAMNRFMLVLTTLYSLDSRAFTRATESLHGRTHVYFTGDARTLLRGGNQTKPKQVPGTPWWITTNTNIGRKYNMIEHIMQPTQSPTELIEKVCGMI